MTTTESSVPSFADLGVADDLVTVLHAAGITAPFPIQSATLPDALAGRDICGKAPTGSGKTLAFGLATMQRVERAEKKRPRALLLAPTRELAVQIRDELEPFAHELGMRLAVVYGGTSVDTDIRRLAKGIDVLVATPGRLEDLIDRQALALSAVDIVVIDEADRMADMGFLPSVKRLLDQCTEDRQTMLFSATLDGDVDVLIKRYQHKPVRHEIADAQLEQGDIRHLFVRTQRTERVTALAQILAGFESAVVFCRTRRGTDRLAKQLTKEGISAEAIHGDRSQSQRERALKKFTDGKCRALCATDVAARGIHIDDVACVVHFDPPGTDKDYIHRSGRTGRAGADGVVVSMVIKEQQRAVEVLQRELGLELGFDEIEDATALGGSRSKAAPKVKSAPKSGDSPSPDSESDAEEPAPAAPRTQDKPRDKRRQRDADSGKDKGKRKPKAPAVTKSFTKSERKARAADAQAGNYVDVDPRKKKREWLSDEEYDKLIELGEAPPRRKRRTHKAKAGPKGRRKPSARSSETDAAGKAAGKKKSNESGKTRDAKRKAAAAKANPNKRRKRSSR